MRVLYDIGANKGLYTDTLIDKYDKCILVEANPELCKYLQDKYSNNTCLLYTSPSPRDGLLSRMPSSA